MDSWLVPHSVRAMSRARIVARSAKNFRDSNAYIIARSPFIFCHPLHGIALLRHPQVAALTEYPRILSDNVIPEPAFSKLFPADARRRAQELLEEFGSTGAYSHSKGGLIVRKHVAEFIEGESALFDDAFRYQKSPPLSLTDAYLCGRAPVL